MNETRNPEALERIHSKLVRLKVYRIITGVFLIFLAIYLVFAILAPFKTLKSLNSQFEPEPKEDWELALINDKTDSIIRSTAVINSKLLLTESDSICFSVNLTDSLISLELQGVTIHTAKISRFKTSRLFSKIYKPRFYKYISTPFVISQYKSSIVKVPIVVKHAPKDTAEANKVKTVPQLPREEFVRVSFRFDKPLKIIIEQEEKPVGLEKFTTLMMRAGDRIRFFSETASGIFALRIPDYIPWIKIKIPRDEAKTIFRALPENAALSLEL